MQLWVILATVPIQRRRLHPSFSASILTRDSSCQISILRLSAVPQASRHRLELPRSAPGPSWNLSGLPWTWPVHATVPCAGTAPAHGGEDHVHQDGRQHIDPGTVWGRWPPVQRCRVANLLPLCTPLRPDDCLRCLPDTRSLSAEAPRFDVDFRRLSISDANGLELDQVPPRALYTVACSLQSLLVDLSKHTHGLEARCLEHSHDARVSRLQFEEQEHELRRLAGHVDARSAERHSLLTRVHELESACTASEHRFRLGARGSAAVFPC